MIRHLPLLLGLAVMSPSLGQTQGRAENSLQLKQIAKEAAPWTGRQLAAPATLSCDIAICTQMPIGKNLAALINLKAGQVITQLDIQAAWSRLKRTGFFSRIKLDFLEGPNRKGQSTPAVYLRFIGKGTVVIQTLDVEYGSWGSSLYPKQFVSEIRKRLPLRRGGSFPVLTRKGTMDEADVKLLKEYEEGIVELYKQQGIFGTKVKIIPSYFGPNKKKVNVKIQVTEGRQPELGQVLIKGAKAFPYWRLIKFFSTGEQADFWRNFFGLFGVGRYSRRVLKDEAKAVEIFYRENGYVSARVRLERKVVKESKTVFPLIHIHEGPHLTVKFEGNRELKDTELQNVLTFKESGAFDETEMEASRQRIIAAYQASARYYVKVSAKKKRINARKFVINYSINEGPEVFARSIQIVGNRRLRTADILKVMETKGVAKDGVLDAASASSGILQDARMINDLNAIKALYKQNGMPGLNFRCANPKIDLEEWNDRIVLPEKPKARRWQRSHRTAKKTNKNEKPEAQSKPRSRRSLFDVWSSSPVAHRCFKVKRDHDPRLLVVRIELDEGRQSVITRLKIDKLLRGMDEQMADEARALLEQQGFINEYGGWKSNVGFNQTRVKAIRGFLLRYLHQKGYLAAQVVARCTYGRGEVLRGNACSESTMYGLTIKELSFDVQQGARTTVSGILLRGNLTTKNYILTDELLMKPGAELGSDELFISQANLRSLGVFDAVNVSYISQESGELTTTVEPKTQTRAQDRRAMVLVTVEESKAVLLDLYVGLQIDSTPIDDDVPILYSIGTSARHQNLFGYALELGVGANHSNRMSDIADIENDYAVWRAGPFFKNRRLLGTRLSLAIEALFERGRTVQGDQYQAVYNTEATFSYDFYNLSYPSRWGRGLVISLKNEFRRERLRDLMRESERPAFDPANNTLTTSPTITWDRRDSPVHPTRGFLLLGQLELVFSEFDGEEGLPIKATITSQYVHSFFKRQLIVVPNLRIGSVWTSPETEEPKSGFFFKAGGDGVSYPIRGYSDAGVEACEGREDPSHGGMCDRVFPVGVTAADGLVEPERVGGHAMILGGLETRFPTFVIDDFWLALFTDFGAISPDWKDMDLDRFRVSVGAGIRWLVSGQIPLRFDVAYPLDTTPFSDEQFRAHLNIFYTL